MTFRVKHNGCISSFLFWEMQRIPFLLKSFRVIEQITSQVAEEFDVLLCIEKSLKWVVCILLLLAIFLMILIVIPPAATASVI